MAKKAIFVTVRTGSTRLPNKSILKIGDKHTIEYVINSVKKSKYADIVVLCTTTLAKDDILCDIAKNNNIESYRGSEHNKWDRWRGACIEHDVDFFVTADGDDLFYDSGLADCCFEHFDNLEKPDVVIDGQGLYNDVYGICRKSVDMIYHLKGSELVEPYSLIKFLKGTNINVSRLLKVPDLYKKKDIRMTLDYPEDLTFFTTVIEALGETFTLNEVLEFIEKNPHVKKINYFLETAWKQNQQSQR